MHDRAVESRITGLLADMNAIGGYPMSLVCTSQGLLIAASGEALRSEITAGLTCLFDDIVARAARDLELLHVDELTLSDSSAGYTIVRPLMHDAAQLRLFLVVPGPRGGARRRNPHRGVSKQRALQRPWRSAQETP